MLFSCYVGYSYEHNRFAAYKSDIEAAGRAQEAKNESIKKQQELVNKGILNEYDSKISAIRNYYSGLRQPSSGKLPTISNPSTGTDESSSYYRLAESCAETTAQLTALQEWVNQQMGIK